MKILTSILLGAALALPLRAGELGDAAAPLTSAKWLKGGKIDLAAGKGKTVYLLHFFSPSCPNCPGIIRQISEAQAAFQGKDVAVIGISQDTVEEVQGFLKELGDKWTYTAVSQDPDGAITDKYISEFGLNGHLAFVLDKNGAVVWHGHPLSAPAVVQGLLDGKYNLELAKKQADTPQMIDKYFDLVANKANAANARELGNQILDILRFDSQPANEFAWKLLTGEGVGNYNADTRDLDLGMRVAKAAYDSSTGKESAIIDTYARAYAETGDLSKAIKLQKQAIELTDDASLRSQLEATLEDYEQKAKGKK